jgi:hypothetical protein
MNNKIKITCKGAALVQLGEQSLLLSGRTEENDGIPQSG